MHLKAKHPSHEKEMISTQTMITTFFTVSTKSQEIYNEKVFLTASNNGSFYPAMSNTECANNQNKPGPVQVGAISKAPK